MHTEPDVGRRGRRGAGLRLAFGAVGPVRFGALVGTDNDPFRLFIGYAIGGGIMIVGSVVELLLGVAAEGRELEQVARPLTAVTATQVPRAPMPVHTARRAPSLAGPHPRPPDREK